MCGLPFSGKTTLAKTIVEKTGAKLIAFDKMWTDKKGELKPDLDRVEEWKIILNEAYIRIKKTLLANKSVVYDDISVREEHREVLRAIAKQSNASFVIVYLNTPMAEIKKREVKNRISKGRHEVESINFEKALAQWQTPVGEEGVIEYKPDMDLDVWIRNLENKF